MEVKVVVKVDMTDKKNCKCEFISGNVGDYYSNNPKFFIEDFEYMFNRWNYVYSWSIDNPNIIYPEITIDNDSGKWFWNK